MTSKYPIEASGKRHILNSTYHIEVMPAAFEEYADIIDRTINNRLFCSETSNCQAHSKTGRQKLTRVISLIRHGNCRQALTYENGGVHVVDVPLGAVLVLLQELLHHEQDPEKHICATMMHTKLISMITRRIVGKIRGCWVHRSVLRREAWNSLRRRERTSVPTGAS
jgi:hypothetical protein